jgi:hypothetical protein
MQQETADDADGRGCSRVKIMDAEGSFNRPLGRVAQGDQVFILTPLSALIRAIRGKSD